MTIKNTILISAATFFVLNFILWAVGWMIWPIVWVASGYAAQKYVENHDGKKMEGDERYYFLLGPVLVLICLGFWIAENFEFPKFRNPFIWPEKELDKQEDKE